MVQRRQLSSCPVVQLFVVRPGFDFCSWLGGVGRGKWKVPSLSVTESKTDNSHRPTLITAPQNRNHHQRLTRSFPVTPTAQHSTTNKTGSSTWKKRQPHPGFVGAGAAGASGAHTPHPLPTHPHTHGFLTGFSIDFSTIFCHFL